MTTGLAVTRGSGLAKTAPAVRELAQRLERARQVRNEKLARADADYVEAVRRAMATVEATSAQPVAEASADLSTAPA